MSSHPLPTGKNIHTVHRIGYILFCICSNFLLLFSTACTSTSHTETEFQKPEVDSLALSFEEPDSLIHRIELYKRSHNAFGEMLMRQALGRLYSNRSKYIDAIDEFNRCLVLAESIEDTAVIVSTFNDLGASLRYLGVTGQSAEYYFRALSITELWSNYNTEFAKKQRVISLSGIGNTQLLLGNYLRAEEAFRSALSGEENMKNPIGQAVVYADLGLIKEKEGQPDSAFYYYECSLEMNRTAKSKLGISLCYNHFGRLAEAKGDLDAALRYYYRSYYIMSDETRRGGTMESSLAMGRVYMKRGDFENARKYIDEGWMLAQKTRSWKMMSEACLLQSSYEEHKGRAKSALDWYKQSNAFKDSMTNERTKIFVQKVRQEYVKDRNEQEMENLRSNYTQVKKNTRAYLAWGLMAGLFALMCIGFLLYTLRVRMRSQAMMRHMEKVRTDFFTNITHEFRTPLTVMLGLGKQIAEKDDDVDVKECRRIGSMIVRQGNSLLGLVNQLLDIARAESAIGREDWKNGDIVPFVSMIVENCEEFANMKNVTLAYVSTERELCMDFVPDYIQKVLINLLTNAIKYSGEGGKVTIQMEKYDTQLRLSVTDTGRGIPEKDIPHIFDAFYTATNCGVEMSTGVGLAMVRQMLSAMNGSVEVTSLLGKGTTFTILLPLKQSDRTSTPLDDSAYQHQKVEYMPSQHWEKADFPTDDLTDTSKPVVLVMEDNRDVAIYIGMQLSKRYRVAYAANGKEGLARAEELMPDLVISDLMMPLMDGYEVCRQIRQSAVLNHIPIIIVSAKSTDADKLKGLEAGADAYLFKPFNADELQVLASNLIEQRKSLRLRYAEGSIQSESSTNSLKPYERDFLNKFVDVVYSQMPKGNIDAESLASTMCMSSSQLRRKIFAMTGEKLTAYVLRIRLKHAQKLLEGQGNLPVADVASRCGFEDAAYFSRIFKNIYQMTPSQYRRQSNLNLPLAKDTRTI